MLQKERLALILSTLEEKKALSLKEVIELTQSSRDTARRDIVKLAENNLIERTYGGISLPRSFKRLDDYLKRSEEGAHVKQQLAAAASRLIEEEDVVFLDVSTTIRFIPTYLRPFSQLFSVTNSIDIADQLLRNPSGTARMLGGNLDAEKRCVLGTRPLAELEDYNFDLAFLSVVGIDEAGVHYAYEDDIDMKKKIRQQTRRLVLVADQSKLGRSHHFNVFSLEEIDSLVTNGKLPETLSRKLAEAHVDVIYTKEASHD
ncbi:DeoR family transcriptional regulator [Enterococcus florum]|uniref:DeoR family transcriptional regulator n=1 Tax=Enterococcus florum TaxID=2480627 RepID=A0A4P5PE43_9ENTE|nr:DeoR/GlpR family DNA-binding transcription regulator [Enterococcus florum]GCF94864.1 DeoR family transcriptional regulator [Enterococcus florum]